MKRIVLLLMGGILIMTTVTGCSNIVNRKSRKDIEDLFSDFTNMFPVNNYDFLYDKEVDATLEEDEVGIWNITTYLYTKENEITDTGVNLSFNMQKKECIGNLFITKKVGGQEDKKAYPLHYKDSQISFVEESVDIEVKKILEEFTMLFEIVDLSPEYLSSLKSTDYFYNSEVPLYGVDYVIDKNDKNIKAMKEHYPSLITSDNIKIRLKGTSLPWEHGVVQTLDVEFDEREKFWFTANLNFSKMKAKDYETEVK